MRLSDDKCDLYFLIQYSAIQITGHSSYIVVSLCDLCQFVVFVADAVRAILSESQAACWNLEQARPLRCECKFGAVPKGKCQI